MAAIDGLIVPEGPFTRIGNQLLEALPLVKLTRTQENICIFLWRRTYGWNRTRDAITLTDFANACGNCKEYVSKQIKILMRKRIIRRIFVPGRPAIYSFVADAAEWEKGCIDLEALERNRQSNTYRCKSEEMIDLTPYPEALWSDQTDEEFGNIYDGSLGASAEEMECPLMEKDWLSDGVDEERENEIDPADLRPADIGTQDLTSHSSQESDSYMTQELDLSTTQELNPKTTQELTSSTTPELHDRTTPEQGPAPPEPALGPPLNTDLKTILKTDRKTERSRKEFTPDMPSYQLATLLWTKIKANIPNYKEPNMQEWSRTMDLLLRVDKIDVELAREVIIFSQEDDFWLTNILSPTSLRKHFFRLDMQRRRQRSGPRAPSCSSGKDDWDMEKEEYEHFFD